MDKVFLAGHLGMVGRATHALLGDRAVTASREQLDLTQQTQVRQFFANRNFDSVILAAAHVGGIGDNISSPADYGYKNGMIILNVIQSAQESGVKRLLFLGSSCMYPAQCEQPMREEMLLTGALESTNEMYGLAKVFGVKLCAAMNQQHGTRYTSLIPCNLYGPHDHFWSDRGHVIPSLMRRFHEAKINSEKSVTVWGDGSPLREFLHVQDLAEGCVWSLSNDLGSPYLNVGSGHEISIRELAELMARVVGYQGDLTFDPSKPNGIARKVVDSAKMRKLGWNPEIEFEQGLRTTYEWYTKQQVGV